MTDRPAAQRGPCFGPEVLAASGGGPTESQRIHRTVQAAARPGPFDDDFSLLVVPFP